MAPPEIQPRREVALLQPEREVLVGHTARITHRSTGDVGPEVRDLLDVRRPILHVGGENRTDLMMLPHVGIKMPEQMQQAFTTTEPVEERLRGGLHACSEAVAPLPVIAKPGKS